MSITIYSTPSCGYCFKVKEYFHSKKIPFTEYNVAANKQKADEMVRKSGQMGVPVIDINGKIIVGFNQLKIEKALK